MMKRLTAICVLAACSVLAASPPEPIYPNLWVHDHFLSQSKAGSLKGDYTHFGMSSESLALGGFSVPFPLELPKERGEILHNPLPFYSHRGGFSEWGMGWDTSFSIHRYAEIGEIDCNGNLFVSPWGKLRLNPQDNSFYPKGLDLDLRVVRSAEGFTAYHPDGRTFYFTEVYADFAWYLKEVKDKKGYVTSFTYEKNQLGRPILKTVQCGGKKHRQYELEFLYEELKAPIKSFESCGLETTIDKIVRQIVLRSWNGEQFQTTKKVLLTHEDRYLVQIDTEFSSGERLPAIRYQYDGFESFLKQPHKFSQTNLSDLMKGLRNRKFFMTSAAFIDINQDGRFDIERADNMKSYVQEPDGNFSYLQEFSISQVDLICSRRDSQTRRLLIRPSGLNDDLHELLLLNDIRPEGTYTKIVVCSLDGRLKYEKKVANHLEPGFFLKDFTHLVDLNGDLKPDLIRVAYNEYAYFLNESTPTEIKFSEVVKKPMPWMHKLKATAIFFSDLNGDRFVDLIAQHRHGLTVWYGKGQAVFGPESVNIRFKTPANPNLNLTASALVFLDVNRDGLTDVFFTEGIESHFFINKGDHFFIERLPSHKERPFMIGYPRLLNVNGTADDQLMMWAGIYGILYYELNAPSTGLLTRVDNGQGIVLDFEYQWTKLKPGIPKPFIIPKSLTVTTAGKGAKKTEFEFIDPQVNLAMGGQLLGFSTIKTKDSGILTQTDYVTSTEHSPKVQDTQKQDVRVSGLVVFEHHDWVSASLEGVSYLKLSKSTKAYVTDTETILRHSVEFLNHDRLCANQTREFTAAGILEKLVSYFDSRACLKSNETLVGPDFVYTMLIDYNLAGLPTNLQLATSTERLQKTALGYDEEFNLKNVTQPSTGTVFLHYDPVFEILKSLQFPDGTWREMTGYSPEADAVSGLLLKGSGRTALEQTYTYDAFYRLKQASSNLGIVAHEF